MQKVTLKEWFLTICVSYTIISIGIHLFEMIQGIGERDVHLNGLTMLYCTAVAVSILYLYYLFEEWPPLVIIIMQYLLATGIVLMSLWVIGHFEPLHSNAYKDMWRSFSIIYILGAIAYYIGLYIDVRKQNKWLKEAKMRKITVENTKENDLE